MPVIQAFGRGRERAEELSQVQGYRGLHSKIQARQTDDLKKCKKFKGYKTKSPDRQKMLMSPMLREPHLLSHRCGVRDS